MRRCFLSVVCASLVVGLAWCESVTARSRDAAAERCAGEISAMRGVWRSGQVFLPAYGDMELVQYIASLARQPGVVVLPVLTAEPLHFRSNNIVFLSTGLILRAGSEQELRDAIGTARVEARTRDLPGCAAMTGRPANFAEVRRRLAGQLAGYEDVTVRQLRIRQTGGIQ